MLKNAYEQGFLAYCNRNNVDPNALLKLAEQWSGLDSAEERVAKRAPYDTPKTPDKPAKNTPKSKPKPKGSAWQDIVKRLKKVNPYLAAGAGAAALGGGYLASKAMTNKEE